MPLENTFKRKVVNELKKIGCFFFVKEALGLRGLADIYGCKSGKFFALEVKRAAGELHHSRTELQRYHLRLVQEAGGIAEFCYPENFESVMNKIRFLDTEGGHNEP